MKNKLITNILLLSNVLLIIGCSKEITNNNDKEFQFNVIDMKQLNNKGNTEFIFKTDKAFISENSMYIKVQDPILILYQKELPYVRISSQKASLIDNGEIIILNNNVSINSIRDNSIKILTENFKLTKNDSKGIIEGGLSAKVFDTNFKSDSAIYSIKESTITFNNISKYIYKDPKTNSTIEVLTKNAVWNNIDNTLTFKSPNEQILTNIRIYKKN